MVPILINKDVFEPSYDDLKFMVWTAITLYQRISRGNSTQCSVVTQMGSKSKKEGICVYIDLIHFAVEQKLTQHCKATILQ